MTADTLANKQRPAQVLLIEDNTGDALLMRRAFKENNIMSNITVAKTGEEALAILNKENEHADAITPDLILLDLNLPQMSGQETLKNIKESSKFRHIPVIILSSSRAIRDVTTSYGLHANGYILKPVDLESLAVAVKKVHDFWFTLAITPDPSDIKDSPHEIS